MAGCATLDDHITGRQKQESSIHLSFYRIMLAGIPSFIRFSHVATWNARRQLFTAVLAQTYLLLTLTKATAITWLTRQGPRGHSQALSNPRRFYKTT